MFLVFENTYKFSVSRFETEIQLNSAQYISKICRYVLDRNHQVKICVGTGMRPNIWREFKERFNIERIFGNYKLLKP